MGVGTGSIIKFIGGYEPRITIITAAHNIWDKNFNSFRDDVWFYCGQHEDDRNYAWKASAENFQISKRYTTWKDDAWDIALCGLFIKDKKENKKLLAWMGNLQKQNIEIPEISSYTNFDISMIFPTT